jgi:hypothetical protein
MMKQAACCAAGDDERESKSDEDESILWADTMKHVGLRVNVRIVSASDEAVPAAAPATALTGSDEDEAASFVLEYRGKLSFIVFSFSALHRKLLLQLLILPSLYHN